MIDAVDEEHALQTVDRHAWKYQRLSASMFNVVTTDRDVLTRVKQRMKPFKTGRENDEGHADRGRPRPHAPRTIP
jgi:hypothetical protein